MATAPRHGNHRRLHLIHPEERRPSPPRRRINPLLLWLGVLGGPLAFGLDRLAGIVLISGRCVHTAGNAILFGLSSDQEIMAVITLLCALSAAAAGILSWQIWRRTRWQSEDQTGESLRVVPFWALGGAFLSGVFFIAIILTGGLAIGISTTCAS